MIKINRLPSGFISRQGELFCKIDTDRVLLSGLCQLYLEGHIFIHDTTSY